MAADVYYGTPFIVIIILIVGLGANVGLSFIPAYMAKNKGYSFGAFWCISFFASFIIGLIIAACIPDKNAPGYYAPPQQPYGQPYQQPGQFDSYCSKCGHGLKGGDPFCPGCGIKVQ